MKSFKRIWQILEPREHWLVFFLMFLVLLSMLLETLSIGLVFPALVFLTQDDFSAVLSNLDFLPNFLLNMEKIDLILFGISSLVVIFFTKALFLIFLAWRIHSFSFDLEARLCKKLFKIYLSQPYVFYLNRNTSKLLQNIIKEVNSFTFNLTIPSLVFASEILVTIGIWILLIIMQPLVASSIALVSMLIIVIYYYLTKNKILEWGTLRIALDGIRIKLLQQGFGAIKEIKIFGRENFILKQFYKPNNERATIHKYHETLVRVPGIGLEFLAVACLGAAVTIIIFMGGDTKSIVPITGLFAAAAFRLLPSMNRMFQALQNIRFTYPIIDILYNEAVLLDNKHFLEFNSDTQNEINYKNFPNQKSFNMIEVKNIYFSYKHPSKKTDLTDVSFTIKKGEKVGIVGPSGAGKSTLVNVFLGLLTQHSGAITIDGVNIYDDLKNWRSKIGYVPQLIYLNDDTLSNNIAYGLPENKIDKKEIINTIKKAALEDLVNSLPDGLNTAVGERGIRLSGGQTQRIGIARALYHDPEILILDEATSALDVDTEKKIMEEVNSMKNKKTLLIISHRLTTVENCDRLITIDKGKIVQT